MATQMAITGKTVTDVIQITPFGFVCNVCGRNVPDSHQSFQRHMQGHKIAVTKSGFSSCVKTLCDMQRNVRNRWDIVALYLTGETKKGFSCNCIVGFQYRHVAQHHVDDNHCGATKVVEEDLHMTTSGQAVSLRAFKVHIHGCSDTTGLRMKNNHASKNFRNIDSTSTESQTKQDQIAPFLRSDEKTHIRAYYDVVHSFISLLDPSVCFQDAMTECVKRWNAPVEESEKSIAVASALCNDWLSNHAWLHVSRTPGNIRAALLVFDATSILDASQNSTFCFRMNTSIVLREAEKLFRYILRLQNDEFVKQLLERECLKPSPNWRIVPKCLRELLLQEGASYAKDTMIVNYCVSRLYRHDGVSLIMSGAGKSANVFGDVLFLMRTAVCSCLYEEDVNGGYEHAEEVIRSVRCSRALNTIAPMIRRLREIENTKPNKYKSTVGTNGDIMVQAFVFRRDIVQRLVPNVVEKCVSLFQQMLVGLQWLSIIDMSQPITVVQDVNGWFTFRTGDGGDCVQSTEMDITNLDDGEACLMSCMGLVDMMFHGFGGGPMRFQELQRMETTDLVWHDNTIYYTCTTKKKFSCLGTGQRVTERKLPHVAARIFLIHQAIVALLNAKGRQICKPFGIDSTHMQDAVSCVFGLRDTPTCLDCRHLWSAVSNIVTNQNNSVEFLSATEESATLAGHSHLTHISRYATGTDIGKEYLFKRYHEFIGCDTMVQQNVECTLPTLDCVDLQCALELIHGRGCAFLSNTQRELVNAIGCSNDHVAAIMNCGAGKSMSWILPILAARSFGRKFGSFMVVLAYRFLTAYHFFSTQQLLESHPNITMTTIFGSDVTERMLPYFMDSCSRLPDIIFTTIDAFASLSRYHEGALSRLSGMGAIARLIFDEAHTMCTELFRSPYEQLRDVGKYNLPVAIMSGSLTESITSGLLSYMGLPTGECNILKSKVFIGCIGEYISINVTTTTGPTATTTFKTMKIWKSFPTHCVHIIVGTKDMGETLLSQIKGDFEIALLISVTSEKDQK